MSTAIKVNDVHKKFKVYYDKGQSLKEKILFQNRNRYEDRWVLKGINLEVEKGEVLGLIGENGCGKSTLLKLLSKIMYPDKGSIEINGKVASLIELGAGFHPDMSGRENIYTNASIFGLTKAQTDKRLKKIIAFSELEEFIDNPVRTYSSGMYMRLAFSVAINVDSDILLIDEILAVGDANFQAKCFDKLRELKGSGMTIVIVTHDTSTIEKFCSKSIWIEDGEIRSSGKSTRVVDDYLNFMNHKKIETLERAENEREQERITETQPAEAEDTVAEQITATAAVAETQQDSSEMDMSSNHFGLKYIELMDVKMLNRQKKESTVFEAGDCIIIEMHYQVHKLLDEYVFGMGIYTMDGICLYGNNTQLDRLQIVHEENQGVIQFIMDAVPFLSGKYILQVAVVDQNGTPMDYYRNYCTFDVVSKDRSVGFVSCTHKWMVK